MGWFWGSSDGNQSSSGEEDPLRNLDPSLRDFLAKESPVKYTPSGTHSPAPPVQAPTPSKPANEAAATKKSAEDGESKVPAQSLYQDGRYAHLWKTYQSQAEVDSAGKSDQEKINDVLEGYKYRKAEIGRAALENCALEQWEVNECFRSGGWQSRVTLCRKENKELERCYMMQAVWFNIRWSMIQYTDRLQKFLKALGYLSTFNQPELDERIQMHADTLYHRMLDREAQIEAAKEAGKPIPTFPPILSAQKPATASPTQAVDQTTSEPDIKPSDLSPAVQAQLKKRLEGLDDKERELEEQAIAAEIRAGEQVAGQLGKIYQKQEEERRQRKEQGRETMGDKLSSLFGSR
jgi:hypothetical protein